MRRTTATTTAAVAALTTVGLVTSAVALWMDASGTTAERVLVGQVSFSAYSADEVDPRYSDGGPVTLTLPGSQIASAMGAPVIWQFTTEGYAQGIAGMSLDVSVAHQVADDGTVTDLATGTAAPGTVLASATVKVYPAAVNDDCSAVPETPSAAKNVYVYDGLDHELQAPGAYTGEPTRQVWCVAMRFDAQADSAYANQVQVVATGADGARHSALDRWDCMVTFVSAVFGQYRNGVDVVATTADGTISRDHDLFETDLLPDASTEPDVTIRLDPKVTSQASPTP
ncbi:MAG: hypothetical protein FWD11_00665 [Micrococcales bacterium]|nr:hypothetical protein [Micrococcales bacterium]